MFNSKKSLPLTFYCLLFLWSSESHSGGEDANFYLKILRECIHNNLVDKSRIPSYMHDEIIKLSSKNYIDHGYEAETFNIWFRSNGRVIDLYFPLNQIEDCNKISAIEVL